MSLLAPLFLLGALAVALPLVFHLIRRTTRERKVFSSLMFLMPSPPRLTHRSRLEHILLLLLRCTVIGLLALGFARPFFKQAVVSDQPAAARRMLLLVDTSASMKRANLWNDARAKVETILSKTTPADQVGLFTFDRQMSPLVNFEEWNNTAPGERAALARRKLGETGPGWSATHLDRALIQAAEILVDPGKQNPGPGEIVLISDLQEGSRINLLQGYEWPKHIKLSVETLKPKHIGNASLQLVTEAAETASEPGTNLSVRVRVSNAAKSKLEEFKVGWFLADGRNFVGKPQTVYVPPGQSRIATIPLPASGESTQRIHLLGDDEDFDNTVFVVPPEATRLDVLYVGGESGKDPKQLLYFLERGFQATRRQMVRVISRAPNQPVSAEEAQGATLLVVADSLPEDLAQAMHDQAISGKTILVVLKTRTMAPTLSRILSLPSLEVEEARPNAYAMLSEIDFRHPVFAPFADPRYSDFTKIHFWKYRRMDTAGISTARVIARFDDGNPALVEVPVGKGRVLALASGWHPDDSQLALSTKFVPMLYSILEQSGAPNPPPSQYLVGDEVSLASVKGGGQRSWVIRPPNGSQLTLSSNQASFSQTLTPGVYQLTSGQAAQRFVVNLDAAEGRTQPMSIEELERFGAPISYQASSPNTEAEKKTRLQNADLESRQKLWRWLILGAIAVLLIETWMAGRAMRRTGVEGGVTS
ncbi:MAG TPA: BatA domain-containing protein [Clostridia bacterium]|nr:BatA domain-containing protein [Clostridia bacterium]